MLHETNSQYVIKHQGSIVSSYNSKQAAEYALVNLKTTNPLYENAIIAVVDDHNREMLLG